MLLVLLCASAPLAAGELYRWVDSAGKVHYGDSVPRDAARVETKKFSGAPEPNEALPYETRIARENFPVVLYVGRECKDYCLQARELLNTRGIPYTEKKLVMQDEVDAFKKASGSDIVPTLSVGRTFLPGFMASRWNNELDIAGYPKTAPYRVPAKPVAPETPPAPEVPVPETPATP